jgi:hypothetical protein
MMVPPRPDRPSASPRRGLTFTAPGALPARLPVNGLRATDRSPLRGLKKPDARPAVSPDRRSTPSARFTERGEENELPVRGARLCTDGATRGVVTVERGVDGAACGVNPRVIAAEERSGDRSTRGADGRTACGVVTRGADDGAALGARLIPRG